MIGGLVLCLRAQLHPYVDSCQGHFLPKLPRYLHAKCSVRPGELEHIMRAVALILSRLSSNPNYDRFTSERTSYFQNYSPQGNAQAVAGNVSPAASPQQGGPGVPLSPGSRAGESEVTLPVPGNRVGAIIGKGGEVINQLKSVVGVRIRISDREDLVPGTQNRKVTISGPTECVQIAQILINQKISAAAGAGPSV